MIIQIERYSQLVNWSVSELPNNQPNFVYLLKYYLANDGQSYASEVNFNAAQDDITVSASISFTLIKVKANSVSN